MFFDNRKVFVNDTEYPLPDNGKFIQRKLSREYSQRELFLSDQGNKDFFKTSSLELPLPSTKILPSIFLKLLGNKNLLYLKRINDLEGKNKLKKIR